MIIDIYTHFLPPAYQRALERVSTQKSVDVPDIGALSRLFPNLCSTEQRRRHMDSNNISLQVLTPLPIPVESFVSSQALALHADLVRTANDSMAETVASDPGRFAGVALLAFTDIEACIAELERCVRELGLCGAMIFTNFDGRPTDTPVLMDLYAKAVELDVPLWLHPISWNYYPWVRDHLIWQVFGWPIDTTLAMARFVYGGVFNRLPALKIITHHAGAAVPCLFGRVIDTHDQAMELEQLSRTPKSSTSPVSAANPVDDFRRFYADTAVSGIATSVSAALDVFGAEHVVYGSDYPFGPESGERFIRSNLEAVRSLKLEHRVTDSILEGNAVRLLQLKQRRPASVP